MSADTAHLDTFARDNLPPRELWPEFSFDLPELQYAGRLNCAAELLDRAIERGLGERPVFHTPERAVDLRPSCSSGRTASRASCATTSACVPGNRVLLRAAEQPDAGRLLVRRAQGGRDRGHDHAAAARARARGDPRQGKDRARALRSAPWRRAGAGARPGTGAANASAISTARASPGSRPSSRQRMRRASAPISPTSTPPRTTSR